MFILDSNTNLGKVNTMVYNPNDDEDPTANECNYNFPQVVVAFLMGSVMMFLLNLNEIQKFKGCTYESRIDRTGTDGRGNVPTNDEIGNRSLGLSEEL